MTEPEWKQETWRELDVTVRTRTTGKAYMDYEVYSLYGIDSNGILLYTEKKDGPDLDPTEEINKAIPLMTGYIRFDGCSHNTFGEDGYIHGCSQLDIVRLGEIFRRLWDIALVDVENMKEFAR